MSKEFQPEENWLLREAANEIQSLRQQNSHMATRLRMFDDIMLLFTSSPNNQGMAMGEDVVWKIEKYLEKFNTQKQ
jgi:hypothetical protein